MGLIKAAAGAFGGALADQWREYFYCDSLDASTLAAKGQKRVGSRSSNTKASDNVISNGSVIAVADGQCMMIVEQGAVVEISAEPGEFVFDSGTEPTVMFGGLNSQNIKKSLSVVGKRFTFGGEPAKDQRVYYFNTKEITGNLYGTQNPVPFRIIDKNIGLDIDAGLRCNGEYSYKITDPVMFYKNVCGNVAVDYKRETIDSQLRAELLTALQPAFARLSETGVRYSALPSHADEICTALNDVLSAKWGALRGIEVCSFAMNSATLTPEDEQTIKTLQKSAVLRDPTMAAATLTEAQAEAMKSAASNENAGSFMAFAGLNMAQNAGGTNAAQLFAMGADKQGEATNAGWDCSCGKKGNTGKFCPECGKQQGAVEKVKCQNCGWEAPDGESAPKFCPECGKQF